MHRLMRKRAGASDQRGGLLFLEGRWGVRHENPS